jgi:pimeloyl-ACP methyl ester carboxylesterase
VKLELLALRAAGGTPFAALDYEPRRARGVGLAVGHGYSSSKQNLDLLCGFLAAHGFNVVSVDFPGHKLGASGGRLESIDDLVATLSAAVEHIRGRYGPLVYTLGHSMGAATALVTAASDPEIAGAVSIATGYGRPSALEALALRGTVDLRSAYVDGLTLPEMAAQMSARLDAALSGLAGRPVLYVAAQRDMMVSLRSAEELFERAPEPKTFALVDSDHTYAGENARASVLAWLNERHPRDEGSPGSRGMLQG